MNNNQELGREGEEIAVRYLLENGYKIIERNFFCYSGEIDIISKDKNEYVFIEVKTRTSKAYGEPIEAVHSIKQKHIWKAAEYYVYKNKLEKAFIRLDVIEVYKKHKKFYIRHIKKAISK